MAVIRVCGVCESSCTDEHSYEIRRNTSIHICGTCWTIIRAIIAEYNKEHKPKRTTKKASPTKKADESNKD